MGDIWGNLFLPIFILCCFTLGNIYAETVIEDTRNSSTDLQISDEIPCMFNTTDQGSLNYDEEQAELHVTVNLLPITCNISRLELELLTKTCDSSTHKIHTPKRKILLPGFSQKNSKPNLCRESYLSKDIANHSMKISKDQANVTIRHVYSGSYCLRIFIHREGVQIAEEHNQTLQLTTNKEVVFPTSWKTEIKLTGSTRYSLPVSFSLPDAKYNFKAFLVSAIKIRGSCPTSKTVWNTIRTKTGSCLRATSKNGHKHIDATISHLRKGTYCVSITPIDERCHPEATYWQQNADNSCTRYFREAFHVGKRAVIKNLIDKIFG